MSPLTAKMQLCPRTTQSAISVSQVRAIGTVDNGVSYINMGWDDLEEQAHPFLASTNILAFRLFRQFSERCSERFSHQHPPCLYERGMITQLVCSTYEHNISDVERGERPLIPFISGWPGLQIHFHPCKPRIADV